MKKQQVAIIGCGSIATSAHLPGYQAAADLCTIRYFCDIIPERARKLRDTYGSGEVVEDYHDILQDPELNAVSVCTHNGLHAPISIDFLRAGKNVLCEKPAAVSAGLAAGMQRAADESGKILNIGVCNRFNTAVNHIKDMIDAGDLGKVYHVYCSFRAHRSIPGLGGPFTTKAEAGGGVLIDWGVHFLDLILYCTGQPAVRTVSASTYAEMAKDMGSYAYASMWASEPDYNGTCDVEDFVTGFIRTDGPSLTLNGAWAQNIGEDAMFVEFLGDKAGVKLIYGGNYTVYGSKGGILYETKPSYRVQNMFNAEIRAFLTDAPAGRKNRASIDNAILTSQLMDRIYESARLGREVQA